VTTTVGISEETKSDLEELKEKEGHRSMDSAIKSLLIRQNLGEKVDKIMKMLEPLMEEVEGNG